eukprot:2624055-Rhodomonas_salina.1
MQRRVKRVWEVQTEAHGRWCLSRTQRAFKTGMRGRASGEAMTVAEAVSVWASREEVHSNIMAWRRYARFGHSVDRKY